MQIRLKKFSAHPIVANIGWLMGDRILRMGIGLIVGVWVTRYLGAEQFGTFNFALAIVALLTPFANLGLDNIVIRNVVRDQNSANEILGTAAALRFIGSIFMNVLALFIVLILRPTDFVSQVLVITLSSSTFFQTFDCVDLWFQSQVQSKYIIPVKLFALVFATALRLLLIWNGASVIAFAMVALIENVESIFGSVIIYHLKGENIRRWRIKWQVAYHLLQDSLPLMLSGIAIGIYMKIDQVMLGGMLGDHEVGIYSVAVRLSELWYFIPLAIVSSTFPSIVRIKQINEALYLARLKKLFILMTCLSYAISIPMTFFSKHLVAWLYGDAFAEAGPVLTIHIWASLAVFLGVIRESWMTTEGFMRTSLVITICGALSNIALNLWFIPILGAVGAALATVISYFFTIFIFPLFIPWMRPIEKMIWCSLAFK